jgi:hypothetical protein
MRILHVGLCVDGKNEGLPYALKEASTFYYEISTGDKDLNDKIHKAIFDWKFDLAFFQVQSPGIVHPFLFHNIQDKGIFTVNWSGDLRQGTPDWYFKTGANLTLFTNTRDVENLRKAHLKADFLQIGIDPKVFKIHGEKRNKEQVVFLGNNYGSQFPLGGERSHLASELVNRGYSVYGSYRGSKGDLNGNQKEESIVYNNSDIAINHSHFNEDRYTSDRMFRILGSGVMCLSHHYPGIEKDFEVGKHLDTYRNTREMFNKITHYLGNPTQREQIAINGYNLCHSTFTYKRMVENLIELYKKYKWKQKK